MLHATLRHRKVHRATVTVTLVLDDLDTAYCTDPAGHSYTIDRRSAVSISALSEGMCLDVMATEQRQVQRLAFEDDY
jgi:hypothetical protein